MSSFLTWFLIYVFSINGGFWLGIPIGIKLRNREIIIGDWIIFISTFLILGMVYVAVSDVLPAIVALAAGSVAGMLFGIKFASNGRWLYSFMKYPAVVFLAGILIVVADYLFALH